MRGYVQLRVCHSLLWRLVGRRFGSALFLFLYGLGVSGLGVGEVSNVRNWL